jgi:spore maturation protein CgeB
LPGYDGILAGTNDLRRRYEALGWDRRILTWYAAADTRIFRPMAGSPPAAGDVVWFCDWGGDHSQRQLEEFLIEPVRRLGLRGAVFGCGFSSAAQALLASAGIECAGWVPTFDLPAIYARYPIALHLPGQPEAEAGTPASSLFQVLACSLPLVCAAWDDVDQLFRPDRDFALARDAAEMSTWLRALLSDANLAHQMARRGHRTVMARHTCARRVDQLLRFAANLHQQLRRRLPAARAPRLRQPAMLH